MNTSKEELKIKGKSGIALIAEKYDVKAVAKKILQLYKEL